MRFLPKVKVVQENLDLSIINVQKAIEKLLTEKFLGYVAIYFNEENEALMLIDKGKIPDQIFFSSEKVLIGKEAKDEIADWLVKNTGHVDIVELNDKAFKTLIAVLYGQNYFGLLDSSYIDFPGLLTQIQTDRLEGSIAINGEEDSALLYFVDGKPSSIYFKGKNIRKGSKNEIVQLVAKKPVQIEFFTVPLKLPAEKEKRDILIGDKKETLNLQKITEEGQTWFEDQYGNRYKKSQIKDLWDKYHIVL
ncbi:hypothetical protein ACFL27_11925 [candidate division CSSED10-310 bacterium]|uniref:DUF4388 domain-containing protein n=1 Tax=candidate division CSSED10-310 bacterium TaxID=2855610 RepID=A0ABV6YXH5_UNCC1